MTTYPDNFQAWELSAVKAAMVWNDKLTYGRSLARYGRVSLEICDIFFYVVATQRFLEFSPRSFWGNDPIWLAHIFQMGWFNHQLVFIIPKLPSPSLTASLPLKSYRAPVGKACLPTIIFQGRAVKLRVGSGWNVKNTPKRKRRTIYKPAFCWGGSILIFQGVFAYVSIHMPAFLWVSMGRASDNLVFFMDKLPQKQPP